MTEFSVSGMTCGHCVRSVTAAIHKLDPGAEVKVDLAAKKVAVDSPEDPAKLREAIEAEGYGVEEPAA